MNIMLAPNRQSTMSDEEVTPWTPIRRPSTRPSPELWSPVFAENFALRPTSWGRPLSVSKPLSVAALFRPLFDLIDGWDGYGALAPAPQALSAAARLVQAIVDARAAGPLGGLFLPDVMAAVNGGILLEWESDEVDLQITVDPDQRLSVYVRRANEEFEGPLADFQDAAASALVRLADAS